MTSNFLQKEPTGSSINATDFEILPKEQAPQSRIKAIRLRSGWVIDNIQVQYQNLANNPPELYESIAAGNQGGSFGEFSLAAGDYITGVLGTWGRQAPGYPKEEIVSLQFQTDKGVTSKVFGAGNSNNEVEPFSFEAPQGYEIIGFFGAYGSHQNALVRLGVYLQPVVGDPDSFFLISPQFNSLKTLNQEIQRLGLGDPSSDINRLQKVNFINPSQFQVIQPYAGFDGCYHGLAMVSIDGKYGCIDRWGRLVLPAQFVNFVLLSTGWAVDIGETVQFNNNPEVPGYEPQGSTWGLIAHP